MTLFGQALSEVNDGPAHTAAVSEHVIARPERPGFDGRVHYLLTGLKEVLLPDQLEQALLAPRQRECAGPGWLRPHGERGD